MIGQEPTSIPQQIKHCILYLIWVLSKSINRQFISIISCLFDNMKPISPKSQFNIIIQKPRQTQRDQLIISQWKNARKSVSDQIVNILIQENIAEQKHEFITNSLQRLRQQEYNQILLEGLQAYEKQIYKIQQSFIRLDKQYRQILRECSPILQILQHKYSYLKVIKIYYKPIIEYGEFILPYSISSFKLFKVIHDNKSLTQATVKGVDVSQFQKFIKFMNPLNIPSQQRAELFWMKQINIRKYLELSIDAKILFSIEDENHIILETNNLNYFLQAFLSLAGIRAQIIIKLKTLNDYTNAVWNLWKILKRIKRIKMDIIAKEYTIIPLNLFPTIRSVLFGGLSLFRQISELSFSNIYFANEASAYDFFGMEQSLATLFENNPITHLKIYYCNNFPIIPPVTALQSIQIQSLSFRKQCLLMKNITETNPSLKSLKCCFSNQNVNINEQLVDQLQTLFIQCSDQVASNISTQSPSNISHLYIHKSRISNTDFLLKILPKLVNLTYLLLGHINFGHELLRTIPSPNLQELSISSNEQISDEAIEAIDLKWEGLRSIQINKCNRITGNLLKRCKFKSLMRIKLVSKNLTVEGKRELFNFKKQGIQID